MGVKRLKHIGELCQRYLTTLPRKGIRKLLRCPAPLCQQLKQCFDSPFRIGQDEEVADVVHHPQVIALSTPHHLLQPRSRGEDVSPRHVPSKPPAASGSAATTA